MRLTLLSVIVACGPGNDVIRGGAGANTIYDGAGNDVLEGGEDGVGWLFGGPGSDQISGGSVIFG